MQTTDLVSPEVRSVEQLVDEFYRTNSIFQRPFAEAAWYFLAHCEEIELRERIQQPLGGLQRRAVLIDEIVNNVKWPLRWIRKECAAGGRIPNCLPNESYDAAWKLYELALEYGAFETAFTYASLGRVKLDLQGERIVVRQSSQEDTRYEAYDRLVKPVSAAVDSDGDAFLSRIDGSVRVSDTKFVYELNPRLISQGIGIVAVMLPTSILLPNDWQFPQFSIQDVDHIGTAIRTMALVHFRARMKAAELGCRGCGYSQAVLVMSVDELAARIKRYTGICPEKVSVILDMLTFGACDQKKPDPALQPLVPLTADRVAIPPTLVLGSDFRRNVAVLLNRMPESKEVYSRLNTQREELCRNRIRETIESVGLRSWFGAWPGRPDLPNIDLVIVSDHEKHCLFLELKAFIEPAEVREVVERDEEITKGILQVKLLECAFREDPTIRQVLGIDASYTATFAVASEFGIGSASVQDPLIPVVRISHLLSRLCHNAALKALADWLVRREFLPVKGVHYEYVPAISRIGPWELEWYGIKPLISEMYS